MKTFICAFTALAIASFAPTTVHAADLDEVYEEPDVYVERVPPRPPVVVYVTPRYYDPGYYDDDATVVTIRPRRAYRPYSYYAPYPVYRPRARYPAGYYPYRWGPRFNGWHRAGWGPRRRW